jgi:hypothetical protein
MLAAALLRFRSAVLTPALVRGQRRNLLSMTALFVLFYTFPPAWSSMTSTAPSRL